MQGKLAAGSHRGNGGIPLARVRELMRVVTADVGCRTDGIDGMGHGASEDPRLSSAGAAI